MPSLASEGTRHIDTHTGKTRFKKATRKVQWAERVCCCQHGCARVSCSPTSRQSVFGEQTLSFPVAFLEWSCRMRTK